MRPSRRLELRWPIERGCIADFDAMERIWRHCFYSELRVVPEERAVLMTESLVGPKAGRERMCQAHSLAAGGAAIPIRAIAPLWTFCREPLHE